MKKLIILSIISCFFIGCSNLGEINETSIPKEIYQAFKYLDKNLTKKDKDLIRSMSKYEFTYFHHSFGRWIRNSILRKNLFGVSEYFLNKEVDEMDDVSSIMLKEYSNYLNEREMNLNKTINEYLFRDEYKNITITQETKEVYQHIKNNNLKQVIEILKREDVRINKYNKDGISLMSIVVNNNRYEILVKLVEIGFDIDIKDIDHNGNNVLMNAIILGNKRMIEYLVDSGVDINSKNKKGENLLHIIADQLNFELLEYFLKLEIDINEKNNTNWNLITILGRKLEFTLIKERKQIERLKKYIKLLTENGAELNEINISKRTLLDYLEYTEYEDLKNYLRLYGAKTYEEIMKTSR